MDGRKFEGKSIADALQNALRELSTTEKDIEYTVIDEGSKGFLNLIGTKPAIIEVKIKDDDLSRGRIFLENILKTMNITAQIDVKEFDDRINYVLSGADMGIIIGYRGETLDSLQYLLSLVVNKDHNKPYKKVLLDAEHYREKREETLRRLADKTAEKVIRIRRPIKLEPMNPYERRIIHSQLQTNSKVITFSEGEEPYRRVVINLKSRKESL